MTPAGTQIEIGGTIFEVAKLPAWDTWLLQPILAPVVAEVIGALGEAAIAGDFGAIDVRELSALFTRVFGHLKKAELQELTRTLLNGATMGGKALFTPGGDPFNLLLQGRTLDTWKLIWFAVRVNYPDFFGASAGAALPAGASAPSSGASST